MKRKVLKTRNYKAGYQVRTELVDYGSEQEQPFEMQSAYTPNGNYIGSPKDAHYLVIKRGIKPELRTKDSSVCSIGFCKKEQKWYGWSHRAIFGYGVGDSIKKGSAIEKLSVGFKAKTLKDAKKMACAFAASV